jgi:hypothetical protein
VQRRGGIGRVVSSAVDAAASGDTGWIRGAVDVPGPSLDDGGGKRPHDGRAHRGLSGDDGTHQTTGGRGPIVRRDLPGDGERLADDIDNAARGGGDATRDQQI